MKFLDEIKFDDKGLIPAVIQDNQMVRFSCLPI